MEKVGEPIEVQYASGYQRRSDREHLQLFIYENRQALRGFGRLLVIALLLLLCWLLIGGWLLLTPLLLSAALLLVGSIGFPLIWRAQKRFEKELAPGVAFIEDRRLRYGTFGFIYSEKSKLGLSEVKAAWSRYSTALEWGDLLILHPAKEKAHPFYIWRGEIGPDHFEDFEETAAQHLPFRSIDGIWNLLFGDKRRAGL